MKEHICMLLGSEKKLTELLGSENNPHLCHVKKPHTFKFCFGLA